MGMDDEVSTLAAGLGSADADLETAQNMWLRNASRPRLLTSEDERRIGLGERVCTCCKDGREALVTHNLRLVVDVAKRYVKPGSTIRGHNFEPVDIWNEGVIGLMKAAEVWDHTRGFKFSTVAYWWVRQAITRALQDRGYMIREPTYVATERAAAWRAGEYYPDRAMTTSLDRKAFHARTRHAGGAFDPTVGDLLVDPDTEEGSEAAEAYELRDALRRALRQHLTAREALVIALRFGLDESRAALSLEQVGKLFTPAISRERVRQIESHALTKLRLALTYDHGVGLHPRADMVGYQHYTQASLGLALAAPGRPLSAAAASRKARQMAQAAPPRAGPSTAPSEPIPRQKQRLAPGAPHSATNVGAREPQPVNQSQSNSVAHNRTTRLTRKRAPFPLPTLEAEPMPLFPLDDLGDAGEATRTTVPAGKSSTASAKRSRQGSKGRGRAGKRRGVSV